MPRFSTNSCATRVRHTGQAGNFPNMRRVVRILQGAEILHPHAEILHFLAEILHFLAEILHPPPEILPPAEIRIVFLIVFHVFGAGFL